jgi:hypothetical protein
MGKAYDHPAKCPKPSAFPWTHGTSAEASA